MPAILVRIMSPPNGHARGGYPPCPPLSAEMKRGVAAEIKANPGIESSLEKLDPAHELEPEGMQKWFEGIRELDQAHAAFGLTVAVCHPHDDVKIAALKVLPGIHELGPVAYLLDVTKSFAVFEAGSENATMHGIVQHDLCDALNLLVNANVKLAYGQDPNGLSAGIPIWRTALASKTP